MPALGLSRQVAYGLGVSHTMNDGSISTELDQFFGAYFHQDWDLEANDWQGIVDNYVDEDPTPGPLLRLAEEIDDLRRSRSEAELEGFLVRQVGVDYGPAPLTYSEWLKEVADRLRERATESFQGFRDMGR